MNTLSDITLRALEFFADPRFGSERRFGVLVALIFLLILPAGLWHVFVVVDKAGGEPVVAEVAAREELQSAAVDPETLGRDLLEQGRPGEAVDHLKEALLLEPDNVNVRKLLAGVLMRMGRYAEGAAEFDHVIAVAPAASDFFFRGLCYQEMQKYEEAGRDFAEAAGREPSNPVFSNKHLIYLVVSGSGKEVARRFKSEMHLGIRSNMSGWVVVAALLAFQDGNPKEGERLLQEASLIFGPKELSTLTRDPAFDQFLGVEKLAEEEP